jgi:hypothetical protein
MRLDCCILLNRQQVALRKVTIMSCLFRFILYLIFSEGMGFPLIKSIPAIIDLQRAFLIFLSIVLAFPFSKYFPVSVEHCL